MTLINIQAGSFKFKSKLEQEHAPKTCERFLELLPYTERVIHSRWSGEAVWIPLGEYDMGLDFENHTSHPSRGDILLYPGGISETEFLFAYGSSCFAAKVGQLAGNHFLTMVEGHQNLDAFGKQVLWEGALPITFSLS